jgi:hypothetical protein
MQFAAVSSAAPAKAVHAENNYRTCLHIVQTDKLAK